MKNGTLKRKTRHLLCGLDDLLKKINKNTLFIGDGIQLFKEEIEKRAKTKVSFAGKKYWYPRASNLALLAQERFEQKQFDNAETIIPLYLYPDDCQVKRR